jgi:hypothetical protein
MLSASRRNYQAITKKAIVPWQGQDRIPPSRHLHYGQLGISRKEQACVKRISSSDCFIAQRYQTGLTLLFTFSVECGSGLAFFPFWLCSTTCTLHVLVGLGRVCSLDSFLVIITANTKVWLSKQIIFLCPYFAMLMYALMP